MRCAPNKPRTIPEVTYLLPLTVEHLTIDKFHFYERGSAAIAAEIVISRCLNQE